MIRFRRILHPTDFSPASSGAYRQAVELAKANRAELLLVHVLAPLVLPSRRRVASRPLREVLPGPAWSPGARILVARVALVTVIGIGIGLLLDPDRAYWIVGAAVAVVGVAADRRAAFTRGLHRMIGTILGAAVYLLLAPLPLSALWLA